MSSTVEVEDAITAVENHAWHGYPGSPEEILCDQTSGEGRQDQRTDDNLFRMFPAEIKTLEDAFDDDTESIITNERYVYISSIIGKCCNKRSEGRNDRIR